VSVQAPDRASELRPAGSAYADFALQPVAPDRRGSRPLIHYEVRFRSAIEFAWKIIENGFRDETRVLSS